MRVRTFCRKPTVALAALALLTLCDTKARAQAPVITGAMTCERVTEPGRVKCSVEARAPAGWSLSWADVTLQDLPDFTAALKGRIGPADLTMNEPALRRWAFGLVAKKAGEGELKARVRAVVCEPVKGDAGARCQPTTLDVTTIVHVG
jgi:hypothetical protein